MVMSIIKTKDAYSSIANKYDEIYKNYKCELEDNFIINIIKKNNIHKGNILDLGCGTGKFLDWFPDTKFFYTGVDIAPKMIDVARYKYPEAKFIVSDMSKKKIYESQLDSIISLFSLSYCLKPEVVLKNCYNALKKDGNIFIVAYTPKWAYSQSNVTISNGVVVNKMLYTKKFMQLILRDFKVQSIVEFPFLLDLIPKKLFNNKFICKFLSIIDKILSKFVGNLGAYIIIHAKK